MKENPYEPFPLEIWRQCSRIQATWTREEELKRRGAGDGRLRPPGCLTRAAAGCFAAVSGEMTVPCVLNGLRHFQ